MTRKDRKKRKINKKGKVALLGSIAILVIASGIVYGTLILPKTVKTTADLAKKRGIEIDLSSYFAEVQMEQADIDDYLAMLQEFEGRDRAAFSAEDIQAYDSAVQSVQQATQVTFSLDEAEQHINAIAYLFDKQAIDSGSGELFYAKGILIANKVYCMPVDFAPGEDPRATQAMAQMASAADTEDIYLTAFSTYRSYYSQESLFNRYVANDGEEAANRYSSRPGCSDHQTGMAFDIGSYDQSQWAETTFDNTPAANWLEAHAHEYGFILRYPQGKEDITGYMHESWHYRYVGAIAPRIKATGLSLEEYLKIA